MNGFTLLYFVMIIGLGIALGAFLAAFGARFWGFTGWPWRLVTLLLGCVAAYGVFCCAVIAGRIADRRRPPLPPCRRGTCRWEDYEFVAETEEGRAYRCRCGTLYIRRRRRVVEVLPDGSRVPYMRYHPLGRWHADVGDGRKA